MFPALGTEATDCFFYGLLTLFEIIPYHPCAPNLWSVGEHRISLHNRKQQSLLHISHILDRSAVGEQLGEKHCWEGQSSDRSSPPSLHPRGPSPKAGEPHQFSRRHKGKCTVLCILQRVYLKDEFGSMMAMLSFNFCLMVKSSHVFTCFCSTTI